MTAALPPYICAAGDLSAIVFGEADPPFAKRARVQQVGKVTGARAAGTREFLSRVPA